MTTKSRRLSKQRKDKIGIALIAGAIAALLAVAAVGLLIHRPDGTAYDPVTLCPFGKAYPHTVVVIDKTDPLTDGQRQAVYSVVLETKSRLAVGEKLSLYVLDDKNYRAPKARFAVCNPGSGKDANPIYQNPRQIEKIYQAKFGKPLDFALEDLLVGGTAPSSPIMEMIQAVSQLSDFGADAGDRHLVIVSDLMHHTSSLSHLKQRWETTPFFGTPYEGQLKSNLKDVQVLVIYLLRPELHATQSQRTHQDFWRRWLERNGVTRVDFRRVS